MNFSSDNAFGVHPAVLAALEKCNAGAAMAYGADPVTAKAEIRAARPVRGSAGGGALHIHRHRRQCPGLRPADPPGGRIYCHVDAHIETSECGAPEFYSRGAKLITLPGAQGKLSPDVLAQALRLGAEGGLNDGRNGFVSITNATEWGTVYDPGEVATLAREARRAGVPLHMDGARFANAVARLGCTPADVTWRAGVDVLCFGGTKNGAMAAEAILFFDPELARDFDYRRKQAGHVLSKQRFLAAQMLALVSDGLWLELAGRANDLAQRLARGVLAAGGELLAPVHSNAVFVALPARLEARARQAGAIFHPWPDSGVEGQDPVPIRLVTSWDTPVEDVDRLVALLQD